MGRNEAIADLEQWNENTPEECAHGGAYLSRAISDNRPASAFVYEKMCHPLGFPLLVRSNSSRVLAAAEDSWRSFQPMFHGKPLTVSITVTPDTGHFSFLPLAPRFRLNGSALVQAADADNYMVADLHEGRAAGRVTQSTVKARSYFRYHFLEAAALSMLAALRCIAVHGACVSIRRTGVLLCGDSGAGKSTLAFAAARAGWTYTSDDATYLPLDRSDRLAVGNCHQVRFRPSAAELFSELEGRAVTPRAAGKPSIEVRTSEWPQLRVSSSAQVHHVVFLNRRSETRQVLVPLDVTQVWRWFKQSLIYTPAGDAARDAALSRLLSGGLYELRYRDLSWAIARIHLLATKGI